MNILIACEESQRVTIEFRKLGHEAFSCDILPCSGGHPEWHIQGDAIKVAYGENWDLMIAHPPCTYLSNAASRWLFKDGVLNEKRYKKGLIAKDFFMKFINADHIPMRAIENPVQSKIFGIPQYTQIIQPYYFGDPYTKATCLWLFGLPSLKPTKICENPETTRTADWYQKGRRNGRRSKTFPGIAKAMAEQWGRLERPLEVQLGFL